jgi:carbonic anhydrase/acetyltransferase-like protein (isoleucine patch superfamily)
VFIASGAVVIGDVTLHENASIWFNAVLRGDTEALVIGSRTNIQDGAILHADPGYPTIVGRGCTVGHRGIVHGARVGDNTLVGMGAILLNGVEVGENCVIGAGALLTQGKIFPPGLLLLGSPARIIRELTPDEIDTNRQSADGYIQKARAFRESGHSRTFVL